MLATSQPSKAAAGMSRLLPVLATTMMSKAAALPVLATTMMSKTAATVVAMTIMSKAAARAKQLIRVLACTVNIKM